MASDDTSARALEASYNAQRSFYINKYKDKRPRADGTFFDEDSVSAWLMRRTHQCLDPLLEAYPDACDHEESLWGGMKYFSGRY